MVFLKELSKTLTLKRSTDDKKSMKNYPEGKYLNARRDFEMFSTIGQDRRVSYQWRTLNTEKKQHVLLTPGRRQSTTPTVRSRNIDQKSIETVLLIAICHPTGDKWQPKTLFLTIFDPHSPIVNYVFGCRLSGVLLRVARHVLLRSRDCWWFEITRGTEQDTFILCLV